MNNEENCCCEWFGAGCIDFLSNTLHELLGCQNIFLKFREKGLVMLCFLYGNQNIFVKVRVIG